MGSSAIGGSAGVAPNRRGENLALIFQEVLTVVARLRSKRQPVTDPQAFREQFKAAINSAGQDAMRRGYNGEDVRVATFPIVALLDESILISGDPAFTDWLRKPLQQEMFEVHVAGEIFFRNVERILVRNDSPEVADVLEVYLLCLLLGFRGRHSQEGRIGVRNFVDSILEKIRRIRGHSGDLFSPASAPPVEAPIARTDPWLRKLMWIAPVCFGIAVILFFVYQALLGSAPSDLRSVIAAGHF